MLIYALIPTGSRRTLRPNFASTAFLVGLGTTILVLGSFFTTEQFFQTFQNDNIPQWSVSNHLFTENQANPVPFDDGDSGGGWEEIKRHLCPQGIPNKAIGIKLFALASLAMDNSTTYKQLDKFLQQDHQNMAPRFYHGFFQNMEIYVDEVSILAYVRIFKCGNNFIRRWLGKVAEGRRRDQKTYWGAVGASKLNEILAFDDRRPYCIITAIRDPISHFLSGYNEMEFRVWEGRNTPNGTRRRPSAYLSLPYTTLIEQEERFSRFVSDILTNTWYQFAGLDPSHVLSMSRVLSALNDYNLTLTAVLPSIQNLTWRFPEFVRTACPHFPHIPETFHVKDMVGQHESSSDSAGFYAAAKSVWSRQGRVAKALCIIHAMDYACWDTLPDGIPPFCQMVYGEDFFIKTILSRDY